VKTLGMTKVRVRYAVYGYLSEYEEN